MGTPLLNFAVFLFFLAAWPLPALAVNSDGTCPRVYEKISNADAIRRWWEEEGKPYWKFEKDTFLFWRNEGATPIRIPGKILKHGTRLALAPTFLAVDVPITAVKMGLTFETLPVRQRMLLVPIDLANRYGPHLSGYTALAMTGYTWQEAARNLSYVDDYDTKIPRVSNLKPGELAVFMIPPGDPEIAEYTYEKIKPKYNPHYFENGQVIVLRPTGMVDFLSQLSDLRKQGRIKHMYFTAHGRPGELDMGAGSSHEQRTVSGTVTAERFPEQMEELKRSGKSLPDDLFTDDAKIAIYSCSFAQGAKGEKILQMLGATFLQNGGTIVGANNTLSPTTREDIMKRLEAAGNPADGLGTKAFNAALNQLYYTPLAAAYFFQSNEGLTPWKVFNGEHVKSIEIPKQTKK